MTTDCPITLQISRLPRPAVHHISEAAATRLDLFVMSQLSDAQCAGLWQMNWDDSSPCFLVSNGFGYLFGPHALRAVFGEDGSPGMEQEVFGGGMITRVPEAELKTWSDAYRLGLGEDRVVYAKTMKHDDEIEQVLAAYRRDRAALMAERELTA